MSEPIEFSRRFVGLLDAGETETDVMKGITMGYDHVEFVVVRFCDVKADCAAA